MSGDKNMNQSGKVHCENAIYQFSGSKVYKTFFVYKENEETGILAILSHTSEMMYNDM